MNQDSPIILPPDSSSLTVEILIEESWINQFLADQGTIIPVNENTHLNHLRIKLDHESFVVGADVQEKENSSIELNARPVWNPITQSLSIEDLKLHTKSKNLVFKSKGWFAQVFLNSKLDKKIAEQANLLFSKQRERILKESLKLPIPKLGNAEVAVSKMVIHEIVMIEHAIRVKATIEGVWKLNIVNREP